MENLANTAISLSKFLGEALVMFSFKSDNILWWCIDCHELNAMIINQIWYFCQLINEIFDSLIDTQVLTKNEMSNFFYHFQLQRNDELKTAF